MRLSIIIPTVDAAGSLAGTLAALQSAGAGMGARDIIVADGGSRDGTVAIARSLGARVIAAPRGRGAQLAEGARAANGDWLLFLHADTRLAAGWQQAVVDFAADAANRERAAYFRFALDDDSAAARRLERLVAWRCRAFALPYGDQGLLMGRAFHDRLGGYRDWPLMEDVDLVRRIGRARLVALPVAAITSAARYRRRGYRRQSLRNLLFLSLYFLGLPPKLLARFYR